MAAQRVARAYQRYKRRGTTTQRGLGSAHVKDKEAKLAAHQDGSPCPYCGRGMYRSQSLELDHWPGRVFGGPQVTRLAHAKCNRSAGASLGNRLRAPVPAWPSTRRW